MRKPLLALLIAAPLAGCVERTISVTSEPAGALVYLNDREVGRTPLSVPFTDYGVYDVRLTKEGCKALWTTADAKAPWWDLPGPDLISEAVPGAKSKIVWNFKLEPQGEVSSETLIEHAQQMKALTNQPQPPIK